ncbi:hypothetical protein AB4Z51_00045 [Bradyrhizobium sp. 2TAF36]|jgi:hypothetical protein|uniref:hypothetical protein n=1 Tax=Bradyrhizobium sp. 2TAF36 TaxID=3233016 RepID=UPI003F919D74
MQVSKLKSWVLVPSTRAGPDSGFLMESPMASITLGDDDCHARRLRSFQADRN